jgi:hypothetical protein
LPYFLPWRRQLKSIMSTNSNPPPAASRNLTRLPRFKVLLTDGADATNPHSKQLMADFVRTLGPDCDIVTEVWNFSLPQVPFPPQVRDRVAANAAAATVILQAIHEEDGLPPKIRTWLEAWLVKRASAKDAVVQVFTPEASHPAVILKLSHSDDLASGCSREYTVELAFATRQSPPFIPIPSTGPRRHPGRLRAQPRAGLGQPERKSAKRSRLA